MASLAAIKPSKFSQCFAGAPVRLPRLAWAIAVSMESLVSDNFPRAPENETG